MLETYVLVAHNTDTASSNRLHDDETARRYGVRGALGPGVIMYGYLTPPLVTALGPAWLERGTITVRFTKPLLDGEELHVTGAVMTRDASGIEAIEAAGAEGVVADPDRLGTLMRTLAGVTAVCWLLGSADDAAALHGDRLGTFMERLVDTPVRGFLYVAAGTV